MSGIILFTVFACLALSGCEDPGTVGSGFTDTGTEIEVDTMQVSDLQTERFSYFTGRLTFISAGRFNDPLFGDMEAVGLMRPALSSADSDTMQEEAGMRLRLFFDQDAFYGNSDGSAEFDLVELDQIWRGKAWKITDEAQLSVNPPLASFSVGAQDSVEVSLPGQWVEKYRNFFESEAADRDSLYRIDFPGLALVPRNSAKIVPFFADSTRFIIENPDEDTVQVGLNDWAYSLDRDNRPPTPAGSFEAHSTLEHVFNFDMQLNRDALGTVNISRVELVFFENRSLLSGSLSSSEQRPGITGANLFLLEPDQAPAGLDVGSPVVSGQYVEEDGSIRFNLTTFVNSILLDDLASQLQYYVALQSTDGIIRSSLLHDNQGPPARQPKIIVTVIQNESEDSSN